MPAPWHAQAVGRLILLIAITLSLATCNGSGCLRKPTFMRVFQRLRPLPSTIAAINSACKVDAHVADLTPANIDELLRRRDLILDGCDNFETRYLINDYATSCGIPWVSGGAVGSYGIVMPVLPARNSVSRVCLSAAACWIAADL